MSKFDIGNFMYETRSLSAYTTNMADSYQSHKFLIEHDCNKI